MLLHCLSLHCASVHTNLFRYGGAVTEPARESGIFSNEIYAGMVIVIALTTLLPPFVMKWYYGRYGTK